VAGIAAGKGTGGTAFSGVAKDANVIAVQVFSRFDSASNCGTSPVPCALSWTSNQIAGLQRVYDLRGSYNIASVNMSLGGNKSTTNCDSDSRKSIIDSLRSVNIATVIASGNSYYTDGLGYPACISTAVSVGSTRDGGSGGTPVDTVSDFSNSASFLNLLAPGQLIYSSVPGTGFSNFNGTSMAAPHVAGAWAVMKQAKPAGTVTEILNAFINTGLSVLDTRNNITKPRIRLDQALAQIVPPTPTPTHTPTRIPFTPTVYVFAPLIARNVPLATATPTPTPTPTSTPTSNTGPQAGFYNSGYGDEFYVTTSRNQVDNFAVIVNVTNCGTIKFTHLNPEETITSNAFSFTGALWGNGTFTSQTSATGQDGLNSFYVPGCGYVSGGPWDYIANWQNSNQAAPDVYRTAVIVAPDDGKEHPENANYLIEFIEP
jgi:hypothetical protein